MFEIHKEVLTDFYMIRAGWKEHKHCNA